MALQTSGAISLLDIQNEFGGSNPIGINEYYGRHPNIPASGQISFDDFYGASAEPTTLLPMTAQSGETVNGLWRTKQFTLPSVVPAGTSYRVVIRFKPGNERLHYQADLQLGRILVYNTSFGREWFVYPGFAYSTFQTTRSDESAGGSAAYNPNSGWQAVLSGSRRYRWNQRINLETPSGGTGIQTNYNTLAYLYAETSGDAEFVKDRYYWLRSEIRVATNNFNRVWLVVAGIGSNFTGSSLIATVAI